MGGRAWGPMGLAARRAWGAPWRRSSLRAGRQMGQGPRHWHPCAVPRALSAWEMRPWQVGSGGDSAPGSLSAEALSHSVQGTPQGSDSDSSGQAPWGHPVPIAKDLVWNGMAPLRPSRNMKQMPVERSSRSRNRRNIPLPLPSASDAEGTGGLGVQPPPHCTVGGSPRQPKCRGTQGPREESMNREAWTSRPPTTCTGALRRNWDTSVGRDYDWSQQVAHDRGSCSATQPSLRRRSLGDVPAEGGWHEWAREPSAQSRWDVKAHSLGDKLG